DRYPTPPLQYSFSADEQGDVQMLHQRVARVPGCLILAIIPVKLLGNGTRQHPGIPRQFSPARRRSGLRFPARLSCAALELWRSTAWDIPVFAGAGGTWNRQRRQGPPLG